MIISAVEREALCMIDGLVDAMRIEFGFLLFFLKLNNNRQLTSFTSAYIIAGKWLFTGMDFCMIRQRTRLPESLVAYLQKLLRKNQSN